MTGRGETHDRSDEEVNRVSRLPHHPRPCHSCPRFVPSLATLIPSLRSAPRRGVYDERVNEPNGTNQGGMLPVSPHILASSARISFSPFALLTQPSVHE